MDRWQLTTTVRHQRTVITRQIHVDQYSTVDNIISVNWVSSHVQTYRSLHWLHTQHHYTTNILCLLEHGRYENIWSHSDLEVWAWSGFDPRDLALWWPGVGLTLGTLPCDGLEWVWGPGDFYSAAEYVNSAWQTHCGKHNLIQYAIED